MKLAKIVVDVPLNPRDLRELSDEKLFESARGLVGTFVPNEGLIVAIVDVKPLGEAYRAPTDCRVYVRLETKAIVLDLRNNDIVVGEVKKPEGRYVVISLGNIASGICHVSHLGPRGPGNRYRYEIELDKAFRIDRETGERREYFSVGDPVRAKVTGGVSKYRRIGNIRFSMRSDRLGPLEEIKRKRKEVLS